MRTVNLLMIEENLTGTIIKVFYKVYNTLGYGFLEKIYQKAMIIELYNEDLKVETEKLINVHYNGANIGKFAADLVIEDKIIVELKAKESISEAHEAQLTNYLRATEMEVGLLLNFGKTAQMKRKIFTNDKKRPTSNQAKNDILKSIFE